MSLQNVNLAANCVRVRDAKGIAYHVVESKKGFKIEVGSQEIKVKQKHLKNATKIDNNSFLLKNEFVVEIACF